MKLTNREFKITVQMPATLDDLEAVNYIMEFMESGRVSEFAKAFNKEEAKIIQGIRLIKTELL